MQKAADACQNVSGRLAAFDTKIEDTVNRLGSGDASGAQQSFADARSDLSNAMSKVQNPQIQKALENVDASTSKLGDLIAGLSTASPAAQLATKASSDVQDAAKRDPGGEREAHRSVSDLEVTCSSGTRGRSVRRRCRRRRASRTGRGVPTRACGRSSARSSSRCR